MARLLLTGAGASFGSDASGTPPLGPQLFDSLCQFDPSGWGSVPPQLHERFRADFEKAMSALGNSHSHSLPPLQRSMAAYFFRFLPRPGSLYMELARRMKASAWAGSVCTTNYERLLELSLCSAGLQPTVGTSTQPGHTVELCLPHGCCHIFCDGVWAAASAVSFDGFNATFDGGSVVILSDPQQYQHRIGQDAIPPVMSYFEPNKKTSAGASFIATQRARWHELALQADKIVVVGIRVRPHDNHIWDPIAQSPSPVVYCSGCEAGDEFRAWANNARPLAENVVLEGYFTGEFNSICRELGI